MKSSAELSEAEARAVGHMMWLACICARKWIGVWDDKRPPRDESLDAMQMLLAAEEAAEQLAETEPWLRDLSPVRGMISALEEWKSRLQAAPDPTPSPR